MSKTTILYKDVAPGAAEDASIATTQSTDFSDVSKLAAGISPSPTITLEKNHWILNGTYDFIEDQPTALWSSELSGDDCPFQNKPEIPVEFD